MPGDLDGDGKITVDDCRRIAAAVASNSPQQLAIGDADMDGDGKVTIIDAMRLHQYIGGLWSDASGKLPPVPQLSDAERKYLSQYEETSTRLASMTPGQFLSAYPTWPAYTASIDPTQCRYYPEIAAGFGLDSARLETIRRKGFVVLPAGRFGDYKCGFGSHYATIFTKDLPVFFTADALLDPLYKAYDKALALLEKSVMGPEMNFILSATLLQISKARAAHAGDARWQQVIDDADVYVGTARALLLRTNFPSTDSVRARIDEYLCAIDRAALETRDFFGIANHTIDFSQFTPRGHYECQNGVDTCLLQRYFQCMMWLGRADCGFVIDSLRHLRDFAFIRDCMEKAGAIEDLAEVNQVISFFVGDIDAFSIEGFSAVLDRNTSLPPLDSVIASDQSALRLRSYLISKGYGGQCILSQSLWKDPNATRPELPKLAQISGQRFILDSYVLGRTVEWYVKDRNTPMLEEIAFCLGNNAAQPVVASDVNTYTQSIGDYRPLHARLGAARVLFEQYPYWDRNLYTLWLSALRQLSAPLPPTAPQVMRTKSWQDKQMNTQLASWAQLRHNTLLYAKQSYTGGAMCSYPDGYVEPYPEFYRTVGIIMERLRQVMEKYAVQQWQINFPRWKGATDTLTAIAEAECGGLALTPAQIDFLKKLLVRNSGTMCGMSPYSGWYPQLFGSWDDCYGAQPSIADVHTIPPSIIKPDNMVLHAATGNAALMIVQINTADSCGTLYAGAVSTFYQHDVSPIARWTDSQWQAALPTASLPSWFRQYAP